MHDLILLKKLAEAVVEIVADLGDVEIGSFLFKWV